MKRFLLTAIIAALCVVCFAQQPHGPQHGPGRGPRPNMEKFIQDRIDFVTKAMGLAADDSAKFVPLYKEMLKEKAELMLRRPRNRIEWNKQYPDSVYTNAATWEIDYKIADAAIEKKFMSEYQKFLTPKQVFSWLQAEKLFIGSFMQRGPRPQRPGQGNASK